LASINHWTELVMAYPSEMRRSTQEVEPESAPPRRVGRRPKAEASLAPEISKAAVIERAAALAQKEQISDISMVRLAREMGVTPALIHYYVGSRDDLLSAVLNFAFRDRLNALPPLTGSWRRDLEAVARVTQKTHAKWPGLAAYIATHNRFRLFQKVQPGETDYGLAFFDHMGRIFKSGGFTPSQAALAYHLLMTFLVAIGSSAANRLAPKEHEDFIVGYVTKKSDASQVPGASYLVKPFAKIDVLTTFESGLQLLLDGFEQWLSDKLPSPARRPKKRAAKPSQ
jgi:AcrR family transcriptional regulator